MNIHSIYTDFASHISSVKLQENEEIFIKKSGNELRQLKDSNVPFHVVNESLKKQVVLWLDEINLASVEKLFQQINSDNNINQDQEFIKKTKKIFLDLYASSRRLPEVIGPLDTENILTYLITKDGENFIYKENSFFVSLTAQSQLEIIKLLAQRGEHEAKAILLECFDKIKDLSIESRLEVAKLIASQGLKAALSLRSKLAYLHLQNASVEQKLDLAAYLIKSMGGGVLLSCSLECILSLQEKEPKEAYLAFFKTLIQKFIIEPNHTEIDLSKLTDKDVSIDEKLILAKNLISLGEIAALYVSNFVGEIHDFELVMLLCKEKKEDIFQSVLDNFSSLNLNEAPGRRIELAKVIFNQYNAKGPYQYRAEGPYLFKLIDKLISPNDSLEDRIHFVNIIAEKLDSIPAESLKAIFQKNVGGYSLPELINLIKKKNENSKLIIEIFDYTHYSGDISNVVSVICEQGPDLTRLLASNLDKFNIANISIQQRLEIIKRILDTTPDADEGIAACLDSILNNLPISERLSLAKTLIQRSDAVAEKVALRSDALKLNEATVTQRVELALMISQQGRGAARALVSKLGNFYLNEAPFDDLWRLAEVLLKQGQLVKTNLKDFIQYVPLEHHIEFIKRILDNKPDAYLGLANCFNDLLKSRTIKERISLAQALIQRSEGGAKLVALCNDALKLNEATPSERLELALMIVQRGKDAANLVSENLHNFYLQEASSDDLLHLAEAFLKQGQPIHKAGPEEFNMKALSIEKRFNLVSQMIAIKAFSFNTAWVDDMPGEFRCKLVKQAIKVMIDSKSDNYKKIFKKWDLHDVSFKEKFSIIELYLQSGESGEHSLAKGYLSFFGDKIEGAELIKVLYLFSRQSNSLLGEALEQLRTPPLSLVACQQAIMEFLIDTPLDLQLLFAHPALQSVRPLLDLLTMKTVDVEAEVKKTQNLPKEVTAAKLQLKDFLDSHEEYKTLRPILDQIEEINNPLVQFKLMRWLAYTAGKFNAMSKDAVEGASKILEIIYAHKSLPNRFIFVRELSHITEPFEPRVVKDGNGKVKELNEYAQLSWVLLTRFKTLGASKEMLEKINDLINGKKGFKETKSFSVLVELLNDVLLATLSPSEVQLFLNRLEEIIQNKTFDKTLKDLQGLTNIFTIFGKESFLKVLEEKNIGTFFAREFEKHLSLGSISDFGSKWAGTFGKSRNPEAIFIYMRSLEKLPQEKRKIALEALAGFIKSVLNGDFPAVRYKTENQPHLAQVFANEEVKKLWMDKGQPIEVGNYIISFSDDFMDLLLSGTEVQASCQDIARLDQKNICLISHLMGGDVMPIVAKPKGVADGKIAARIFVRLGWDKVQKCHVILQECLYSNVQDSALEQGMTQMALTKAKQLGSPLVEKDRDRKIHGDTYPGTFSFLGGDYPYVYSDAAGGEMNGIEGFDIKGCHLITPATS